MSDEVPKRIALKLKGVKSANAPFTAVKFRPQMKLIATSIKSTEENLFLQEGWVRFRSRVFSLTGRVIND
jgi:hypothetical protein